MLKNSHRNNFVFYFVGVAVSFAKMVDYAIDGSLLGTITAMTIMIFSLAAAIGK